MRNKNTTSSTDIFANHFNNVERSLNKIRSLVFNKMNEHSITSSELEDFNESEAMIRNSLSELEDLHHKLEDALFGALNREERNMEKADKYYQILFLVGLNLDGIMALEKLPVPFIQKMNERIDSLPPVSCGEQYFEWIEQRYRFARLMIDRDMSNLNTIKLQKRLYKSDNLKVKSNVKAILEMIADKSQHMVDDMRKGMRKNQLLKISEKYWYERA
ncbi:hypothetical protein [Maribellus sediminis]|uniref:hypothetical protein n=1 Tax=Maribellus sediminis TaxID=2696285 RepID=UPI001431EA81|nr:hypothetical protein [Maribellus sediminis]